MANMPKSSKNSTEFDTNAVHALAQFNKAKATIKRAEVAKAKAEALLRVALAGAKFGTVDGVTVVSVIEATRTSLDGKVVQALAPEVYDTASRSTTYDYLKSLG